MGGSNVNVKSSQKRSGFECNVQYRGCLRSTIHDTSKNHRHFAGPVPLKIRLYFCSHFGAIGFKYIIAPISVSCNKLHYIYFMPFEVLHSWFNMKVFFFFFLFFFFAGKGMCACGCVLLSSYYAELTLLSALFIPLMINFDLKAISGHLVIVLI